MELKQLESFTAVVECESFTRAAEKLFISQPTVSAHVRALEEELHSRLIVRTTKSIQVTPRGRELYECACGMLTLRNRLTERWAKQEEQVVHLGGIYDSVGLYFAGAFAGVSTPSAGNSF